MNNILKAKPSVIGWMSQKAFSLLRFLLTVAFYLFIAIVAIACALLASHWIELHFPRDLHLKRSVCTEIDHFPLGWTTIFFFTIFIVIPLTGFQILGLAAKIKKWAWKKCAAWILGCVTAYAFAALISIEIYKIMLVVLYA